MNIAFVASPGGHSAQLKIIFNEETIGKNKAIFITEIPEIKGTQVKRRKAKFLGRFDEYVFKKDYLKFNPFVYFIFMIKIMRIYKAEKIECVVTDGAQISIPAVIAARLMGIKSIFMDTFIRVKTPNWSARACYLFSNIFLVQHDSMRKKYGRKARYEGSIL